MSASASHSIKLKRDRIITKSEKLDALMASASRYHMGSQNQQTNSSVLLDKVQKHRNQIQTQQRNDFLLINENALPEFMGKYHRS